MRVVKNCKLNEDMDKVRALELPARTWDVEGDEEWFKSVNDEGRGEDEEAIDREADLQPKREEQLASLLLEPEGDDTVDENRVAREAAAPDGDKKTIRLGARRSKRRKPPGSERPKQAAKKKRCAKLAPWSEDKKIMCLQDNPKAKDTASYDRYERYKAAKTVGQAKELKASKIQGPL